MYKQDLALITYNGIKPNQSKSYVFNEYIYINRI